ncbi:hypothetical protein FALBO_8718 [Fusarium albosuccineum]|uniref:Uncharacterized protein n=1 Tax=Fusarium albosuccineum TaxID=1237068 RepID=A0A8H4LBC2_9HYPO|nr:hypothetical protein FALBO_8718 [Fusarium albosuccineum]
MAERALVCPDAPVAPSPVLPMWLQHSPAQSQDQQVPGAFLDWLCLFLFDLRVLPPGPSDSHLPAPSSFSCLNDRLSHANSSTANHRTDSSEASDDLFTFSSVRFASLSRFSRLGRLCLLLAPPNQPSFSSELVSESTRFSLTLTSPSNHRRILTTRASRTYLLDPFLSPRKGPGDPFNLLFSLLSEFCRKAVVETQPSPSPRRQPATT